MEYLVRWQIEVEANSPEEAIEIARECYPIKYDSNGYAIDGDGNSTFATIFEVQRENSREFLSVDIDNIYRRV